MDVKEAVRVARDYLRLLEPSVRNLLLEEVEQTKDGRWLITLSHGLEQDLPFSDKRSFKVLRISKTTGEVESMKIRQTA